MKKYKQIEIRSHLKTFSKILSGGNNENQSLLLDSISTVYISTIVIIFVYR